jgi:mRNA deadenylase 3'-5' endonuclease subunit Ccr4
MRMPAEQELRAENGGLPSTAFPSDHLLIMAEFGIVDKPFAEKHK